MPALDGSSTSLTSMSFRHKATVADHCVASEFRWQTSCVVTVFTHCFIEKRCKSKVKPIYSCRWLVSISLRVRLGTVLAHQISCYFVTRLCHLTWDFCLNSLGLQQRKKGGKTAERARPYPVLQTSLSHHAHPSLLSPAGGGGHAPCNAVMGLRLKSTYWNDFSSHTQCQTCWKSDEFISSIPKMQQRDRVEEKRNGQSKREVDKVRVHFTVQ